MYEREDNGQRKLHTTQLVTINTINTSFYKQTRLMIEIYKRQRSLKDSTL